MKKVGMVAVLALVGVLAAGCAGSGSSGSGSSDRSVRSAAIGSSTPVAGSGSISSAYLINGAAIRVDAWDWNIKNTTALVNGSGLTAGKAQSSAFSITKNIDNASTQLYVDVALGKHLQTLTFKVGTALTYTFSDVVVTSVHQSGNGSDGNEDVSFAYSAVKMTNAAGGVNTYGTWDFSTYTGTGG
jgi:type VI protein secretion system component Hcp